MLSVKEIPAVGEKIPIQVTEGFSIWDESGNRYHTVEVQIPLHCPTCDSSDVSKYGIDYHHSQLLQRYQCNSCGATFYAHTSHIFLARIKEFFADLLQKRGIEGERLKSLAEKYGVSESQISKLYQVVRNRIINKLKVLPVEPPLSEVLIMDEQFLKICGHKKLLLLVVNLEGTILAFRLAKQRTSKTIGAVLKKAIEVNGQIPKVMVTDGFTAYKKVVRAYYPQTIHVRHIHKPAYDRLTVEYLAPDQEGTLKLVTLHTTNDLFTQTGTNYGVLEIKPWLKKTEGRKRNRENNIAQNS